MQETMVQLALGVTPLPTILCRQWVVFIDAKAAKTRKEEKEKLDNQEKEEEEEEEWEVEALLERRIDKKGRREYLVKWKGCSKSKATWEPVRCLTKCKDLLKDFDSSRYCYTFSRLN